VEGIFGNLGEAEQQLLDPLNPFMDA